MSDDMKKKIKTFAMTFLENLLEIAENLTEISVSRHGAYRRLSVMYGGKDFSKKIFTKELNNLKHSGYLKLGSDSIVLTNKAKMKLVDSIALRYPKDNKYYLVSFDIPEQMRTKRNKFRRIIKKLGFVQIQKSLWALDKNVGELVEIASYEYEVEKYVAYFVSIKSNIDGLIQRKIDFATQYKPV